MWQAARPDAADSGVHRQPGRQLGTNEIAERAIEQPLAHRSDAVRESPIRVHDSALPIRRDD